jgi:hypothetical protein
MLGTAWKRWKWLEEGVIPLAATLMHAAWAYPLFSLFTRNTITGEQNPGFTFWLCLFVLIGGVVAGKVASRNNLGFVIVAVGGLAAIWISLLLAIPVGAIGIDQWFEVVVAQVQAGSPGAVVPVPFVVGLATTFLWWRGVRIASEEHTETIGSFAAGVTALIGLFLLSRVLPSELGQTPSRSLENLATVFAPMVFMGACLVAVVFVFASRVLGELSMVITQLAITIGVLALALVLPVGPQSESLGAWSLLFIASGLTTLALNGVLHTLRDQAQKTGIVLRVDRYWAMTVAGVVAVVLIAGLIIGQIISPGMIAQVFGWLRPIWAALGRILMFLIFVLAYLFFGLLGPLLEGFGRGEGRTEVRTFESPVRLEDLEDLARDPVQIPPIIGQIVRIALIVGAVALLVWFFVRAVRRRSDGEEKEDEVLETRETILSLDLLRSQLDGLLSGLRRQRAPPLFVELDPAQDPRQLVRELYQKVLARAVELDLPRRREQTPARYQRSLLYLCSSESEHVRRAVEILTAVYEVARYGVDPPTADQVQDAQDAFAQIEAALQSRSTS